MNKVKNFSPTVILISISVFFIVLSILILNINSRNSKISEGNNSYSSTISSETPSNAPSNYSSNVPEEKVVYIVKEYNGKVAVFEKGKEKPFKITEVNTSDLPQADREILKSGIETDSQKKLTTILEDYCS